MFICVAFLATACGQERTKRSDIPSNSKIQFDPLLGGAERSTLNQDISKLTSYQIEADPRSYFGQAFGGGTSSDVLNYIEQRVKHVIPQNLDLDSRIKARGRTMVGATTSGQPSSEERPRLTLMAANIGFLLWLTRELNYPQELIFVSGSNEIPLDSSRNGIIELGEGYVDPKAQRELRIATLVHEARHSDCTGGLAYEDLQLFAQGGRPSNEACGYPHVKCEPDNYLAGEIACDGIPWGAYSIEAVYSVAVNGACNNCNEQERQIAQMVALDGLSRLKKQILDNLVEKRLPAPDMSSSGMIGRRP
jgi:hypothetical protein